MNPTPFGRYELLERVAMGGMAEVFRARSVGLQGFQKQLCIKRILPQFSQDEEFVRMFIDEAKLVARLQHANIVQVFDFDQVDGSWFIAMEFVDGRDLRTVIRLAQQHGMPLGPFRSALIAAEMCKGLHHAHVQGGSVVHRDVSPHNVLVSLAGEVKVMDFGIAKATDRITRTSTGTIKGKFAYMAPEQAADGELDARVDQFATGLVLYEMLTGRRAYDGAEAVALRKALHGEVEPPSLVVPEIPPELDEIFVRATRLSPAERFPDMRAMERALVQFVYSRQPPDDETDLAAYMRKLVALAAPRPRTQVLVEAAPATPAPPEAPAAPATAPAREPAGLPGSLSSAPTSTSMPATPVLNEPTSVDDAEPPAAPADETVKTPSPLTDKIQRARHSATTAGGDPQHATRTLMPSSSTLDAPVPPARFDPATLAAMSATDAESVAPAGGRWRVGLAAALLVTGVGAMGLVLARNTPADAQVPAPSTDAPAPAAAPSPAVPPDAVAPPAADAPPPAGAPAPVQAAMAPAQDKPADTSARDAGASPPREEPAAQRAPARVRKGRVLITAGKLWGEVLLRGRRILDETPGEVDLEPGTHQLLIRNPTTGKSATVTVTVKSGGTTHVQNPLK